VVKISEVPLFSDPVTYTQGQEDKQAQTQTHITWKRNAKVTTINKF